MHHTWRRRVGLTATLVFGLIIGMGAAVRPLPMAPIAAAQTISAMQAADDEPAEDETTDEQPAVEGTPTPGAPATDAPPPAAPPMPSPVASPAAGTAGAASASTVPAPPTVAAGVRADDLKGNTVFRPGLCPTEDAGGFSVDEGFGLAVRGRCGPNQNAASIAVPGQNIAFTDGDLALDFKLVLEPERSGVTLYVRSRDGKLLATYLNFQSGEASLYRRESGANTTLAITGGLLDLVTPTDWNRLALRVRGGEAWVLLNDQPVLYAADVLVQEGGVGVGLTREGNVDDDVTATAVFRDLTVSTVEPAE